MKAASSMHLPKENDPSETSFDVDIETLLGAGFMTDRHAGDAEPGMLHCPDCEQMGQESILRLYQINFEEAVYLCPSHLCLYPMKEENFINSFIIRRDASLLSSESQKTNHLNGMGCQKTTGRQMKLSSYTDFFQEFDPNTLLSDISPSVSNELKRSVSKSQVVPIDTKCLDRLTDDDDVWLETTVNKSCDFKQVSSQQPVAGLEFSSQPVPGDELACANISQPSDEKMDVATDVSLDLVDKSKNELKMDHPLTLKPKNVIEDVSNLTSGNEKPQEKPENLESEVGEMGKTPFCTASGPEEHAIEETPSQVAIDLCGDDSPPCADLHQTAVYQNPTKIIPSDTHADLSEPDISLTDDLCRPPVSRNIIQWLNKANSCWLDCILMCLVNSVNVRAILNRLGTDENQVLKKVCLLYDFCQERLKEGYDINIDQTKLSILKRNLDVIREEVLSVIRQRLPVEPGVFQSLLEMFPPVLKTNESIELSFKVQLLWEFKCGVCGHSRARRSTAHIVSFPYTGSDFHPLNAYFKRKCFKCNVAGRMTMLMEKLPPCLIFHFQNGLQSSNFRVLDFGLQGYLYSVFAVVQYIVNPTEHFITWLRDAKTNKWLRSDDLEDPVCCWQSKQPELPPSQIHMVLWERQSVVDPKCANEMSISTLVNQEAASIADEIPVELFHAYEVDEAIVLSEDDVLHKFNSVEAGIPYGYSGQEGHSTVGTAGDVGSGTNQSSLYTQAAQNSAATGCINNPATQGRRKMNGQQDGSDNSHSAARGISVFPDLNGMQTIQIVAPENTCNIIIMAGEKQQKFVYSSNRLGTIGGHQKRTHSFLDKIHPYKKGSRRASISPGLYSDPGFQAFKPKRQFRLSGYTTSNRQNGQFSPLKISNQSGNATVTEATMDRSDSEKWSEASELSDLFPEFDISSSSGHYMVNGNSITQNSVATHSAPTTPTLPIESTSRAHTFSGTTQ